jgi:hypothetical protein
MTALRNYYVPHKKKHLKRFKRENCKTFRVGTFGAFNKIKNNQNVGAWTTYIKRKKILGVCGWMAELLCYVMCRAVNKDITKMKNLVCQLIEGKTRQIN